MDFKRFYLVEGSVPSIYAKPKDSLAIDYPRNEGRLADRFFPEKRSLDVSLRPYRETSTFKIPPPPPPRQKKRKSISLVGLFEIYVRSSEMTDPRPCPRGWAYFRVASGSRKTCQAQTNNKLSAAKIDIFRGQRNIKAHPPPQASMERFSGKNRFVPRLS